jgi:hypothetical protein
MRKNTTTEEYKIKVKRSKARLFSGDERNRGPWQKILFFLKNKWQKIGWANVVHHKGRKKNTDAGIPHMMVGITVP